MQKSSLITTALLTSAEILSNYQGIITNAEMLSNYQGPSTYLDILSSIKPCLYIFCSKYPPNFHETCMPNLPPMTINDQWMAWQAQCGIVGLTVYQRASEGTMLLLPIQAVSG